MNRLFIVFSFIGSVCGAVGIGLYLKHCLYVVPQVKITELERKLERTEISLMLAKNELKSCEDSHWENYKKRCK